MGYKMLRTTVVLLTLAAIAFAAPTSDDIYNNVVIGDIDGAVAKSKELQKQGKGDIITEAVNRLIRDSQRNTMEYAYQLWSLEARDIVKERFPIQFRMMLGEHSIKLINKRDNLAMKLGVATDNSGDRIAYGAADDKTSDRVAWKFVPLSEDKRVYFKILNVQRGQYLKLGVETDSDGEHMAYASSGADTFRHQWYLQPAKADGNLVFFIVNREYNHALKLGRSVDSMGDRQVWGHNGNVIGNPELFGWSVVAF
ncbi:microvitellogenin isoform X1 [Manduca sexta]|nr:microvitellogenin isoform X1 [Manduca sexta]XP_037301294.1 microvitellogenin isoform X1 [Manduca sexta]